MREHGLFTYWLSYTLQQFKPKVNLYAKNILNNVNPAEFIDPLELTVIYFAETWSLFQLWGIGMLLGIGVFIAEIGMNKAILKWHLKHVE